ncbi:LysR substrate-binding domain-containing protein [Pandoraea sp. CB10b_02]|uniref:LysR family transcriptional regulator n=1 Tax=Pandoraea sp. CB10b_02 TaxID=2014535 RepID=UPI00257F304E|nr:LysR substrate-binding domain-containing protein [Pandoraea sp. CB10b_02]
MASDAPIQRPLAMSLRQIETFRAIMITGSITEAAKMLFITQPSASRILAAAESRVGFPLFERSKGRLFPTPEARRIYNEVETAYAGVQRVDDLVRAIIEGRSGKLNIVCSPSLGAELVPRAIALFNRRYPDLQIHFEPLTHNNLIPRVLLGKDYLGVSMFGVNSNHLKTEALVDGPMMCISPPGWLAPGGSVRVSDLPPHPWIDYGHDTPLGAIVGDIFGKHRRPSPIVEVRSAISARVLVKECVGVAIVDPFCIDASTFQRIDVHEIRPARKLRVHAVYSQAEPLSHAGRAFIRTLQSVLEDHLSAIDALRR